MRLDKFVSLSAVLSLKQAVEKINDAQVVVNGQVITDVATQVHENNAIALNGVTLETPIFRYIVMHKPAGTVCSNRDEKYPSLFNVLNVKQKDTLHIAGRLDVDTTGMVLITDDGRWSFRITSPNSKCPKVYRVSLSKAVTYEVVELFKQGIQLQGHPVLTLPAKLHLISSKEALLTIVEGKFHQVKRMFAAVGNRVISLHRQQMGSVTLDVDVNQWRYLTTAEVQSFVCLKVEENP